MIRLAFLLALLLAVPAQARDYHDLQIAHADGSVERFKVEWATDEQSREYGLMNRRKIPDRQGMLFLYPEPGTHAFWMKDTLVSLDMVFFKADGTIVYIHPDAVPLDLTAIAPSPDRHDICAVLELAGGQAAAAHLKAGDRMVMDGRPSVCLPDTAQ